MKVILAPVDFSEISTNALSFAAEICKRANARLIVVNILQNDELKEEAKASIERLGGFLNNTFGGLTFELKITEGDLIHSIKDLVSDLKPDMIVMGTKGASGLKRILIGSNTVNVLSNVKVPVLVIPETARFERFLNKNKNRVVLATDLDELEDDDALDILKEIALLMVEPKVRILNIRPKDTQLDFQKSMERSAILSRFSPEIDSERATVFSATIIGGINYYLNEHVDTGLLSMIARDTGHLIQKHYTHEMASHTHLPLLVLHDAAND